MWTRAFGFSSNPSAKFALSSARSRAGVLDADPRVALPLDELAAARPADELPVLYDRQPARQYRLRQPLHANALKHRVVHAHMMRRRTDHLLGVRVKEHQIGIRANGNRSLTREEPKELRRGRRHQLHEAIRRKSSAVHSARVNEAQAMLDSRPAVGNFRKVVLAHLLLLLEAKRAVIGRDNLQRVVRQAVPEFFLIPL